MRRTTALVSLALVLGLAPAATGVPRASRAAAFRAWADGRARLAERIGLDLPPQLPGDGSVFGYVTNAGDLDRDGYDDLVDVRTQYAYNEATNGTETFRLDAYRGRDGAALWHLDVPAARYTYPIFTQTGDGHDGVLVLSVNGPEAFPPLGYAGADAETVTSYDGAGRKLWTYTLGGVEVSALLGGADGGNGIYGPLQSEPGKATDLLVQTGGGMGAYAVAAYAERRATQVGILDGATGSLRQVGTPILADYVTTTPVEDLDGDHRDDVVRVEYTDGQTPVIRATRSSDGSQIWTATGAPSADSVQVRQLPDVTGDGVADLGLRMLQYSGPTPTGRIALVDGRRGTVVWTKPGTSAADIGNADRRAGHEVVLGEPLTSSAGYVLTAYDRDGRALWSRTVSVPTDGMTDKDDPFGLNVDNGWQAAGDTGNDGVADVTYWVVVSAKNGAERRAEGLIDGRTGRQRRDPAPDIRAAGVSFDGRGADSFAAKDVDGMLTVTAWQGDAGKRLWTVAVPAPGTSGNWYAGSFDRDRCGDLVVGTSKYTASNGATMTDVVLSGATGRPLWLLTRTNMDAATVSHPAGSAYRKYATARC